MTKRMLAIAAAFSLLLSGCGRDMAGDTYTSGAAAGKVLEGTIISTRVVKIKDHDKLQDNTIGGLAGGAGGAMAGSAIGNGNGSVAGAIGGAVIGAVAGAVVQDALGTSEGMEYLVKISTKNKRAASDAHKKRVREDIKGGVMADMNAAMDIDTQTDIVSVVQKADPQLHEGSAVYIVYHDDRPRLTPRK